MGKARENIPDATKQRSFSLASAVAWIASLDSEPDDERVVRSRARKRIATWVDAGVLSATKSGRFRRSDLVRAIRIFRARHPDKLKAVPGIAEGRLFMPSVAEVAEIRDRSDAVVLPGDLARCHDEILKLNVRLASCECELTAARERLRDLERDALQRAARQAKGKVAGDKGGRGKTK